MSKLAVKKPGGCFPKTTWTKNASLWLLVSFLCAHALAEENIVKLSESGICHDKSSSFYSLTKRFDSYPDLEACLDAGGRLPKNNHPKNSIPFQPDTETVYRRDSFKHWIRQSNCRNTRHELLRGLSTSIVEYGDNPCTVEKGKWFDSYSGQTFFSTSLLDIDHIVPLLYAWKHGAAEWTDDKRSLFANDERNLIPVQSSLNREKGAKSPLEWLPPNQDFHCQYITRFKRITLIYKLRLSETENQNLDELINRKCRH